MPSRKRRSAAPSAHRGGDPRKSPRDAPGTELWPLWPEAVRMLARYRPDRPGRRRRLRVGSLHGLPPVLDPPGWVADWWWDPFHFPRLPRTDEEEFETQAALRDALWRRLAVTMTLRQRGQLRSRPKSARAARERDLLFALEAERAAEQTERVRAAALGRRPVAKRIPRRAGRPAPATDWTWRPHTAQSSTAQVTVWGQPGRPASTGRAGSKGKQGRIKPPLDLYAPDPAVWPALRNALESAWDVRLITALADLVGPWRDSAGHDPRRVALSCVPLVYAPDGAELTRANVWDDPDRGPPPAGQNGRTLVAGGVLKRVLLDRPCVVYATSLAGIESIPLDLAGLPVRPVFDARREWRTPTSDPGREGERPGGGGSPGDADSQQDTVEAEHRAAHWAALRAAVGRAAADDVAHRAWRCLMEWADTHLVVTVLDNGGRPLPVALAGTRAPWMRWPPYPPGLWPPRARRTADALRRLFLRPEAYPDAETLAAAVGLDAWALERWADRYWLAPFRTVRDVLLAFHAAAALWDLKAAPSDVAAALRLDSGKPWPLVLLLRGCTGMPPARIKRWGVAVGPDALLDAVLARRPSATAVYGDGVYFWEGLLGAAPPPLPLPAVHLAPDPNRLEPRYADLPRFVANVLPTHPGVPGDHPYAYANPASPYHAPGSSPARRPEPAAVDGSLFGWTRLRAAFSGGPVELTPGASTAENRTLLTFVGSTGVVVGRVVVAGSLVGRVARTVIGNVVGAARAVVHRARSRRPPASPLGSPAPNTADDSHTNTAEEPSRRRGDTGTPRTM